MRNKILTQIQNWEQIFPLQFDIHGLRDGCQRPGLRGRTPTALDRTLILSYYKGKFHFLFCLSVKLTQMLYVPWVGQRHSIFCGKANASGPAYFCNLEGTLPAGGEFVEPCSVQDLP